jgi:hypothetical protein
MLPADSERFCNLIRGMGRVFGSEPDQVVLDVYWLALKDWTLEEFEAGCANLLGSSKFMPRPADFNELRNAGRMTAGEAFAAAMAVARQSSQYRANTSGDARIDAAAAACGGYFAMGMYQTEKLGYLERRFTEHFESISDATEARENCPLLTRTTGPVPIANLLVSR